MKPTLQLLLLVLWHSVLLSVCDVITDQYPTLVSECRDRDSQKQYKCILSNLDKADWSRDDADGLKLRLRQDFYWHPTKRIRRECRALTREEFKEMVDAINALKKDKVSCLKKKTLLKRLCGNFLIFCSNEKYL